MMKELADFCAIIKQTLQLLAAIRIINKNMDKNQKKFIRFLYRFFTLNDTPHCIAAGAAVGLFMGILPVEGVITSLLIATIFRLNRAAAMISVAAANIWAMIATLPLAAAIGSFIFGMNPAELVNQFHQTYRNGWGYLLTKESFFKLTFPLITGYVIAGGIISLAFYFFLYFILKSNFNRRLSAGK